MPDYKPFGSWAPAMQDAPDDQGQNVLAPGQAAMLRRYMGLPPSWGEAIAANQAVQQAKPSMGAQLGDILGKVPEAYGHLLAAPINMVSGLYNKVAAADEAYRNPSTSSDVYADPYAVAKDPDVPATALSLMGAGVPFAKPGTMGIAGGRLAQAAAGEPAAVSSFYKAHPDWIDQRLVTGKNEVGGVPGQPRIVDVKSLEATPELYKKNVDLLRNYPNMPEAMAEAPHG